ncbi:iron-siderophore ABC transporter substrate-binding protein [Neorhizobium galegae]|uniref:Iron(3+)-hydroxamate-binding protein FhuD n=1 Tax=Neorhizobium galegae bv. orientalis str. HAMBI 540 TaxID=1028800 RepID=A0A068T167_NEOGA|nr:iron-siderophore ABC transporter substrate-binding protein [Neorhizobium galegae]MCQ1855139.1 iron-siderophore ABC transporter substrate-binding protein [Neorhizobium galegae]CDN52153.1 Iron(3+)-hydroxamate-binding protein FhuD [Neorhizobium galegae bv. orientalis str. HAMBI 540]CDZ55127.1 Iron(3+)-hydroxamate-binding protein FhuD [Neorhizobium galegae bv. orientalis]
MKISRRSLLHYAAAAAVVVPKPLWAEVARQRVVSLDYGLSSTLLSLGLPPVGISDLADWDKWVVEPVMPQSVVDIGSSHEVDFEVLIQLKPDIILTTPYLDELLPRLQPIAKILRLEIFTPDTGPILPAAIAATHRLAAELGHEAEAEQFLARSDAFFERCRRRLAGRTVPSVTLVSFMDARHARVYSAPGLFHNALERIGVRNAWTRQSNYWGFETIGIEELSVITDPDARLIAFDPVPPDVLPKLVDSPLWQVLPFSRPGHLSVVPPALMFGMVNEAMRFAGLVTDVLEQDA